MEHSRENKEDMCITSKHLRELDEAEREDLIEEDDEVEEDEVNSEASDTEMQTNLGHDRVQVSDGSLE